MSNEQANTSPFTLQATERDNTLNPRQLRTAGFLPATLYGKEIESQSVQVRELEFTRAYAKGNRVFKLEGIGEAGSVVANAYQVQIETLSGKVLSIQFLHVSGAVKSSAPKPPAPKKQKESEKSDSSAKAETVLTGA